MKKKRMWLVTCLIALAIAMFAAVGCDGCGSKERSITLDVTGVPTSVNVGNQVTLPKATATDSIDGDISQYILVSVDLLKDDGTVRRSVLHEKPGNEEQTFTVTDNNYLKYNIVYTVSHEGVTAEKTFTLTAIADNEAPVLTVDVADDAKLTGKGGEDIKLPHATATDNPGNKDIAQRIEARLYEVIGEEVSTAPLATYSDFTEDKTVRIPSGNYQLVYTVSDVAGNQAEKTYRIPVEIAQPDSVNLIKDKANFAHNNQVGKSWFNDRNELAFGNTAPFADFSSAVGWSLNTTKIYEQYVGITFNADAPGANGQWFYTFAARGSKHRETLPSFATSEWPPYMYMRVGSSIEVFAKDGVNMGERGAFGDKKATVTGTSLLNGQDHVIYLQYLNYGKFDAEDAENDETPAILFRGWVDKDPSGEVSFQYSVIPGDADGWGQLERGTFAMLWEESAAGWLSVSATPQQNIVSDDDHMRIKAVVVYGKDTEEFATDITPPKFSITVDGQEPYDTQTVRALNKAFDLPFVSATEVDDANIKVTVTKPDGTTETLTVATTTYTPAAEGTYTILYEATDAAGNCAYETVVITVATEDTVKPTLTVTATAAITAKVGETVTLSAATAVSSAGIDLTDKIVVEVKGPEHHILGQGESFAPKTPGAYTATYRVRNSFGVYADEVVINITVQSNLTQDTNLAPEGGLTAAASTVVLAGAENIYDERITTVINFDKPGLVLMNVRGEDGNLGWPDGFTLGIFAGGGDARNIAISYNGHNDQHYYANTTFDNWTYRASAEIVLEWQLKTVTVNGKDYIRTQVWVQGELLTWSANGCGQANVEALFELEGDPDEVAEGKAAYLAVEDIPSRNAENIYSTQFFFYSHESTATIKEFYINASETKRAALLQTYPGPKAPEGYTDGRTYNNDGSLKTVNIPEATKQIEAGKDACLHLATDVNESLMVVSVQRVGGTINRFLIGLTGQADNAWGSGCGLTIWMGADGYNGVYLQIGATTISALAWADNVACTSYTWAYKLTYVNSSDEGLVKEVKLQIWGAPIGEKPVPVGALSLNNKYVQNEENFASYDEETKTWTLKAGAFGSAAQMAPDCSVYNPGQQNDGAWNIDVLTLAKIEDYVAHEHTFETAWTTDGVGHWHAANCAHTAEKGSYAEHEYDATYKCTVCDYQHEHTFAETWSYDETNHWHAPTCGHEVDNRDTDEHNMVAAGDIQECEVCKYTPHVHTFATEWSKDATYHWHEDTCDHPEAVVKVAHTYDDKGVCSVCEQAFADVTIAFPADEGRADILQTISGDVGENYVIVDYTFTINGEIVYDDPTTKDVNERNYYYGMGIVMLGGATSVWQGDLIFWASADGYRLRAGGPNGTEVSNPGVAAVTSGKAYTFVYKATYGYDATGAISEIKLDMWHGEKGKPLTKIGGSTTATGMTYDAATKQYTITPEFATNFVGEFKATNMVSIAGAFNNTNDAGRLPTDWDVKISMRDTLPTATLTQVVTNASPGYYTMFFDVTGWAEVNVDYDKTEAYPPNIGWQPVPAIWINMYNHTWVNGSWCAGLSLRIDREGAGSLWYGHVNTADFKLSDLTLPSWIKDDAKFTVLYKTVTETDGVRLQMWIGSDTQTFVPITAKGSITNKQYVSLNAETNDWFFTTEMFTAASLKAGEQQGDVTMRGDCTVQFIGTFGGADIKYNVTAKLYSGIPTPLKELGDSIKETLGTAAYTQAFVDAIAAYKGLPAEITESLNVDIDEIETAFRALADEKIAEVVATRKAITSASTEEEKTAANDALATLFFADQVVCERALWVYLTTEVDSRTEYVAMATFLDWAVANMGLSGALGADATAMPAYMEVYYNKPLMVAIDALKDLPLETEEDATAYKAKLDAADAAYETFKGGELGGTTYYTLTDEQAQAKCFNYSELAAAHAAYDAYVEAHPITPENPDEGAQD